MNTIALSRAYVELPADCISLLAGIVSKFGGRIIEHSGEAEETVVVPPVSEQQRVGRMLRGARLRAGMTQKALAAAIGVPQSHISEYEKNKRRIPPAKAEELARILETVPTHFLPRQD